MTYSKSGNTVKHGGTVKPAWCNHKAQGKRQNKRSLKRYSLKGR